jgi:hypothetical protein
MLDEESENKEEPEETQRSKTISSIESPLNFKHWAKRSIIFGVVIIILVVLFDRLFPIKILAETLIALGVSLCIGFAHEYLHYRKAIKLKYEVKWYRTRFTMGFSIKHKSIRGQRTSEKQKIIDDIKTIGRSPYIVLVPLSILVAVLGWWFNHWGLIVAGIISLAFHGISYPKEGRSK